MRLSLSLVLAAMVFAATAQAAQCPLPLKPTLDARYLDKCTPKYPPDDGFAGQRTKLQLQPGKLIDRFVTPDRAANDNGQYFSPEGEAYSGRALPYVCDALVYTVYQVRKPTAVVSGEIAPWFGSAGGGTQYYSEERLQSLLDRGAIVPVQWYKGAPCDD